MTYFQKRKYIIPHGSDIIKSKFSGGSSDKINTSFFNVDSGDMYCTPRSELIRNASGAGKKIENIDGLKIYSIHQNIEQTFFCQVSCGPDGQVGRGSYDPRFMCAADYAHKNVENKTLL